MNEQYCFEHASDLAKAVEHAACTVRIGVNAAFRTMLEAESLYRAAEIRLEHLMDLRRLVSQYTDAPVTDIEVLVEEAAVRVYATRRLCKDTDEILGQIRSITRHRLRRYSILAFVFALVGCNTRKDELRITKTETVTLHRHGSLSGDYDLPACLITAVGRDDAGKVEVKAEGTWGGCPQVGSTLLRCKWKGTGFAHEIVESKDNCADGNNPAFYITEEKEIQ